LHLGHETTARLETRGELKNVSLRLERVFFTALPDRARRRTA